MDIAMYENLTADEALDLLFSRWNPVREEEEVPLWDALGRVLSREYRAKYDIPVVRASAMDGIAVPGDVFRGGTPDMARWKPGVDYVRADTGDDFDDRFDTVIAIEDVTLLPEGGVKLSPGISVHAGQNVRPSGSLIRRGEWLADPGLPLRSTDLASLASGGWDRVFVSRRPKVVFQPTGSELVPPGTPLQRGCNYDANSYLAYGSLKEMGAEPVCRSIVPDDPEPLHEALDEALADADIVIFNGGSSRGEEDYNTGLLEARGELLVHRVKAGPGRPVGIALIDGKPVINLAGPTLGALHGLEWCIRPIISHFLRLPVPVGRTLHGFLTRDFHAPGGIRFLCMMDVWFEDGAYRICPLPRGETETGMMLSANAMYFSPEGEEFIPAGTEIAVDLLRDWSLIPVMEGFERW